ESLAQKASEIMGLTSEDLKVEGFVDTIIPEPEKGAQADFYKVANDLRRHLVDTLMSLKKKRIAALLEQRYKKIRELGVPL
ncbi:MAG: acetyl-CoA carboxylase carboxyl transferase subunit alpha, partial [Erysipelotrichaceae bacterium]|nr:acetyl-CoA carboxylase carboxyl transferase subunit alpha [Erysipelotrichaceae bacterium]